MFWADTSLTPMAQNPVDSLPPGRTRRYVPITTLASGFQLGLTIHVITGKNPGPYVGISDRKSTRLNSSH